MARARTITRSIEVTSAEVFVLDMTTGATVKEEVVVTGTTEDKDIMTVASETFDTPTTKCVAIVPDSKITTSKLYEMEEATFAKLAICIGEGRK